MYVYLNQRVTYTNIVLAVSGILLAVGLVIGCVVLGHRINSINTHVALLQAQTEQQENDIIALQMVSGGGLNVTSTVIEEQTLQFLPDDGDSPATPITYRFIENVDVMSGLRIYSFEFDPPPAPVTFNPTSGPLVFSISGASRIRTLIQPEDEQRSTTLFETERAKFNTLPPGNTVRIYLEGPYTFTLLAGYPMGTAPITWSSPFVIYVSQFYIGVRDTPFEP